MFLLRVPDIYCNWPQPDREMTWLKAFGSGETWENTFVSQKLRFFCFQCDTTFPLYLLCYQYLLVCAVVVHCPGVGLHFGKRSSWPLFTTQLAAQLLSTVNPYCRTVEILLIDMVSVPGLLYIFEQLCWNWAHQGMCNESSLYSEISFAG